MLNFLLHSALTYVFCLQRGEEDVTHCVNFCSSCKVTAFTLSTAEKTKQNKKKPSKMGFGEQ